MYDVFLNLLSQQKCVWLFSNGNMVRMFSQYINNFDGKRFTLALSRKYISHISQWHKINLGNVALSIALSL